jgi:predicted ATPase
LLPEQEGPLVAEAVLRFLSNIAGPNGTLLVLDNLHLADAAALDSLATLVRSANTAPLRIVAAYRDTELSRSIALSGMLTGLTHEQLLRHATLSPLSKEDATELLAVLVDTEGEPGTVWQDRVLRQAGGIPFYLVAWAQEWLQHRGETTADDLPWSVRQSIRQRIDAAPPTVRGVLEAMTVADTQVSHSLLLAIAALPADDVFAALDIACRERLLEQNGDVYRFAYDAVRSTVEVDMSTARRLLIQQRLAAVVRRDLGHVQAGMLPDADRGGAYDEAGYSSVPDSPVPSRARRGGVVDDPAYHLAVLRRHRSMPSTPK